MNPARVALRHVRREQDWEAAEVTNVRGEFPGTFLVRVRVREPATGTEVEYGIRVGRRGEVLADDVPLPAGEERG